MRGEVAFDRTSSQSLFRYPTSGRQLKTYFHFGCRSLSTEDDQNLNSMEHPQHSLPSSASNMLHSISKKQPPAHKRHSKNRFSLHLLLCCILISLMCILVVAKPCKYFQTDRCPFPADVCNFAHILLPASTDGQSAGLCRHYAAGKCQNGPQCHYRHLEHGMFAFVSRFSTSLS